MFTKLNRVLLVSGLAVASAALLSPSAFAGTTSDTGTATITGTMTPLTTITVTPGGNSFTVIYDDSTIVDKTVATVGYFTNVVGNWDIKASGGNGANAGKLVAPTLTATIPYALRLDTGAYVQPTTAGAVLASGNLPATSLTALTVAPVNLQVKILQVDTRVPTLPAGSPYAETVTLTFTSGQI